MTGMRLYDRHPAVSAHHPKLRLYDNFLNIYGSIEGDDLYLISEDWAVIRYLIQDGTSVHPAPEDRVRI